MAKDIYVLVVENYRDTRELLADILEGRGFYPFQARSLKEGVEILDKLPDEVDFFGVLLIGNILFQEYVKTEEIWPPFVEKAKQASAEVTIISYHWKRPGADYVVEHLTQLYEVLDEIKEAT